MKVCVLASGSKGNCTYVETDHHRILIDIGTTCLNIEKKLKEKKKELEREQKEIKEQSTYRNTDEYIEDLARKKFGLVYDNEVVFKAK